MKATVIPKMPPNLVQGYQAPVLDKIATEIIVVDDKYMPCPTNADHVVLVARTDVPVIMPHRSTSKVNCGIKIKLPQGYKAEVRIHPEWAFRGLLVPDSPATFNGGELVDVFVQLINCGRETIIINDGDHFAFMTVRPTYTFDWVTDIG